MKLGHIIIILLLAALVGVVFYMTMFVWIPASPRTLSPEEVHETAVALEVAARLPGRVEADAQATIAAIEAAAPVATATARPPVATARPPAETDQVLIALQGMGFTSRQDFIDYFQLDVAPYELHNPDDEPDAIAVKHEKDNNNYIKPFKGYNPSDTTFDGWRASTQPYVPTWDSNQAKVPPGGPWMIEGMTVRPPFRKQ